LTAIKSVSQRFVPSKEVLSLMETFRKMTNVCISMGIDEERKGDRVMTLMKLCRLSYHAFDKYDTPSYYKVCAISRAVGILSARNKSLKRGVSTKKPYAVKSILTSCYGFKVEGGRLKVPLGSRRYAEIPLNRHTLQVLSEPALKVRSFTLSANSTLSLCISKEVKEREVTTTAGVDRNLRNVTYGNCRRAVQYYLGKAVNIAELTRSIISSFKRNDVRIRRRIAIKYGKRRATRIRQMLHWSTKQMVKMAIDDSEAIVLEDIRGIRKPYQKGNGQGPKYRGILNSWSFFEVQRQIEYKARWEGIPTARLTGYETRGTSSRCPKCGERLQWADREDVQHRRQLWCRTCQRWLDRDVAAVMNQSLKGWVRLAHSKGEACEAMKGNQTTPVILRVDASKSGCRQSSR
jgi:putative transposase